MKARRRSRPVFATQRCLLAHFVAGTPARSAAEIVGVNRNTATLFYHKLREIIIAHNALEAPLEGEIEVDESYFGGHRKGKRGRGAVGKVAVFWATQVWRPRPCSHDPRCGKPDAHVGHSKENTASFNCLFRRMACIQDA
ncbi:MULTISPECIES: hypothetical protein [Acetobacteraceae]|uniref:hypothetical protein n=1 Tax=Acetobacteraceae TaxID=433 RepID=UPI0035A2419C